MKNGDQIDPPELEVTPADESNRPHVRRRLLFAIVSTAMMMASVDQTIVSTALPNLRHSLGTSISWSAWTITVYELGLVVATPIAGRISDQFGRKRVFVFSIVTFILSSLLCSVSTSIVMLVIFRFIQALGGGGFVPSATGIIIDNFGRNRDRAIGMLSSTVPVGSLAGPVIGGLIISVTSWRYVFLINVPIGALVLVLAVVYVPASKPRNPPPLDVLGVILLVGTILPFMFGITELGEAGISLRSYRFYGAELIALCCVVIMIRHFARAQFPLIPIYLLRFRASAAMNFVNFLYGGCVLGFAALVPIYAEDRYHFPPLEAGTLLTSRAIGTLIIAAATSIVLRHIGYRIPMLVGFSLAALGLALLGRSVTLADAYIWLVVCSTIMGLGNGIAAPSTYNALYSISDPKDFASIAGLRGMFRQIGAIVVISVTTSVTSRSLHPGIVLGDAFVIFAVLLVIVVLPMVFVVPNHKGAW